MKKRLFAFSLISLLAVTISRAQENQNPVEEQEYEPIVSMLDSLVTLNNVIRWTSLDENCFDKSDEKCIIPSFSDAEYESRMNSIVSPIPLSYNRYVKEYIGIYAEKKRALTQRMMGLSNLYFPLFEEVLDKEGLPLEFKYLSVVESALNPVAVSRVGATGLWQFMYNTGIMYNLKVNSYTDDRRDPVKATQAACKYFKDMYSIYGDWLLVIASYNCGPGNVNKAIKRSGGKTNFWEIMPYLPKETRGYVPAFIAVTYVMNYSREHNLYPVTPAYNFFEVDTIAVNRQVNFSVLSKQLDIPADVISYLNPIYKRNLIPSRDEAMTLRLPTNKIAQFLSQEENIYAESAPGAKPVLAAQITSEENEDLLADASGSNEFMRKRIKKTHTVRSGETLSTIAAKYKMTVTDLKKQNRLRSSRIFKGQKLTVTTWAKVPAPSTQKDVTQKDSEVKKDTAAKTGTVREKNSGQRHIYYVVQPGDTLWNIARRYEGLTVEQIKDINNLRNSHIKAGTKLKLILNG